MLDIDHTIVSPKKGTFPKSSDDFIFLNKFNVIKHFKSIIHDTDIILITNQSRLKNTDESGIHKTLEFNRISNIYNAIGLQEHMEI